MHETPYVLVKLGANIPVVEPLGMFVRESEDGVRGQLPKDDDEAHRSVYSFRTRSRTGKAWFAKPFSGNVEFSDKMVIKVAFGPSAIVDLRAEYKTYMKLSRLGYKNVVSVYGLFTYIGPQQDSVTFAIMLMDHGGLPLSNKSVQLETPQSL